MRYHIFLLSINFALSYAVSAPNIPNNCHLSVGVQAIAEDKGRMVCRDSVLEDLTVNGPVTLYNTLIKGKLDVKGRLQGYSLQVNGTAILQQGMDVSQAKFRSTVMNYGELNASQSIFADKLTLQSQQANFDRCQLQDVLVKNIPEQTENPVIHLMRTTVNGEIKFESSLPGKIILDAKSQILGKITHATLVKSP